MAGIPIAFNDVLHQYGGGSLHKRFKMKRQGRDPLSQPGGGGVSTPGASSTDAGNGGNSLSLGRPSDTASPTDDDDEEESTTSEPTSTRTRTTIRETPTSTTSTEEEDTSTSETTSETSTSETSSSVSVITTTIESTSTSTSFSSIETTSEEPTTTLPDTTSLPTTTSSPTTRALITSIVTASASALSRSSASNALASSASDSNGDSSGPSTGTVVGIVAGALVGVVVLSGIVGYVFRTKCSNKNDEDDFDGENPFGNIDENGAGGGAAFGGHRSGLSRSELRRDSQLLADEGDSIHQMSELGHGGVNSYGNAAPIGAMGAGAAAAGAYALHRGDSTGQNNNLPGLQRGDTMNPRPPTMIQRHYAQQQHQQQMPQQMPSFQPGQIVYPSAQINQSGPYPTFPNNSNNVPVGGVFPSSGNSNNGHSDLNRNQSYREQQQQYPSNAMNGNGDYQYQDNDYANDMQQQHRSGTPEYANPQQYFHQASDSFGSGVGVSSPFDDGNASPARHHNNNVLQSQQGQQQYQYDNGRYDAGLLNDNGASKTLYAPEPYLQQQNSSREIPMKGSERAKRTLSVRNGGAVDDETPRDSVYGGM